MTATQSQSQSQSQAQPLAQSAATSGTRTPATATKSQPPATAPTPAPAARRRNTVQFYSRLRLAAVGVMIAVGVAASWLMVQARLDLSAASDHVGQYTRIQTIQADLLRADAQAAESLLYPAADAATFRQQTYTQTLGTVSRTLVEAAATSADKDALTAAQAGVISYVRQMEGAITLQATNPAEAATRQAAAGTYLRTSVLPELAKASESNVTLATTGLTVGASGWIIPTASVAILALVGLSVLVARRSHRYVNIGLALAILACVAMWALASTTISALTTTGAGAAVPGLTDIQTTTTVRIDVTDARAQEVRALVAHGSGSAAYWTQWTTKTNAALNSASLVPDEKYAPSLAAYVTQGQAIRSLDGSGSWQQAVTQATSASTGSSSAYSSSDDLAQRAAAETTTRVVQTLNGNDVQLYLTAAGLALIALLGAVASAWGLTQRLKEYR